MPILKSNQWQHWKLDSKHMIERSILWPCLFCIFFLSGSRARERERERKAEIFRKWVVLIENSVAGGGVAKADAFHWTLLICALQQRKASRPFARLKCLHRIIFRRWNFPLIALFFLSLWALFSKLRPFCYVETRYRNFPGRQLAFDFVCVYTPHEQHRVDESCKNSKTIKI